MKQRPFATLMVLFLAAGVAPAAADQFLGSYQSRLSSQDHYASDGYPLDNAAQVVRQDRANVHKFGRVDADDEYDPWFGSANARARLQTLLERRGAIDEATRRAIMRGQPLVQVDVYRNSARVRIIGY
jgi:hypothetical protein